MLLRLLRERLAPYRALAGDRRRVPVPRRASRCSTCPTLNADIIDNGVATGDTDYILAHRRA